MTAGRAGERTLEAKHKVLERGIQPHSVLGGEAPSRGAGTTSSGVKILCLFVTVFALDLGWYMMGSINETLFCVLHLSWESKERVTLGSLPSLLPCCSLTCPTLGLPSSHQLQPQRQMLTGLDDDTSFSQDTLSLENAKICWAALTAVAPVYHQQPVWFQGVSLGRN